MEYSRASLDEYDQEHRNILHYASESGDIDKCRYLVERCGMSVLDADRSLITPYEIAYRKFPDTLYRYYLSVIKTPFEDMYANPIRRGFFPDPSIIRVNDDYYMVNSSFIFFPCIPVSHSTDLVHWQIIGHAVMNPAWSELGALQSGRGYWAPDISYDGGRFYITATYRHNDGGAILRRQMVVSSDRPEGPYTKPVFIEEDGIDPSLFHENGRHYMLLNRGARILELSEDCTEKISDASLLYYGFQKHAPEGPHLLKKDGWYYLFLAEGGTGDGHRITVSRCKELFGIYEPCPYNPIMRQNDPGAPLQRCGHGKPVQTQDGRWYMVYLCGRKLDGKYTMLGRETALDEIRWAVDGWPVVNDLKGPSSLAPLPFKRKIADADDTLFCKGIWPSAWMTPREPKENAVNVYDGYVQLLSSPAPFYSPESRNLFLHRQESFRFEASLTLDLPVLKPEQEAGLVCYYDENSYVSFMIRKDLSDYICVLEERIGKENRFHEIHRFETQCSAYRFNVETEGLKRTFILMDEYETELCRYTLNDVSYLSDEGVPLNKRFTGALFGAGAYGKESFVYRMRDVIITNHSK